jgi:hypothetical protein
LQSSPITYNQIQSRSIIINQVVGMAWHDTAGHLIDDD